MNNFLANTYKSLEFLSLYKQSNDDRTMLKILILTTLCYGFVSTAESDEVQTQQKRGILEGAWNGISNQYSYGHGQTWSGSQSPWKPIKVQTIGLDHYHHQLGKWNYINYPIYKPQISHVNLHESLIKTQPIYITKHIVHEKRVPVPQPVYVRERIPVGVPVPVEKIIHKTVPVPVPVPQIIPVPVPVPVHPHHFPHHSHHDHPHYHGHYYPPSPYGYDHGYEGYGYGHGYGYRHGYEHDHYGHGHGHGHDHYGYGHGLSHSGHGYDRDSHNDDGDGEKYGSKHSRD